MAARSDSVGPDSVLEEELDVLRAIYIHELVVEDDESGRPSLVHLTLHPATGDDVTQQFVCMTLFFSMPNTYPDDIPEITIRNPRGLAEEEVQRLQEDMIQLAKDRRGGAMLFELIEMAKEILTEGNIPRCPCVVCMEHFHEGDLFTRTDCYHYFHQACLARYVEHALTLEPEVKVLHINNKEADQPKVVCPVCRNEITYDLEELKQAPAADDDGLIYKPSEAMVKMQREMAELYSKQKAKGGIIDLEAEKNRYLVNEGTVVTMTIEDPKNVEAAKKPPTKSEKNVSGRPHHQNTNVVAKYKGPPRRNRPNSDYQGRNSARSEKGSHTDVGGQRGDNSVTHRGATMESAKRPSDGRRRNEADRRGERNYEKVKNYVSVGRDEENEKRNKHRQEFNFEARDGYHSGYRGGRRGGRGGYRQGFNRTDHDLERDDYNEKNRKWKDTFDHSDMEKEVQNIEQKSNVKHNRRGYSKHNSQNTNNSCDNQVGDKGSNPFRNDSQEGREVSSHEMDKHSVPFHDKKESRGRDSGYEERRNNRRQEFRHRDGPKSEDWDRERCVVDSPDKVVCKSEKTAGDNKPMTPEIEKPKPFEKGKLDKDFDRESKASRTKTPSESENWDEEMCKLTREKADSMGDQDDRVRDSQHTERREWGQHSQGRGHGRKDRGGRHGARGRHGGHQSHEHFNRDRQRDNHGQRRKTASQSEDWDQEQANEEGKQSWQEKNKVDRKHSNAFRTENKTGNQENEKNVSECTRDIRNRGGGQHPRSNRGRARQESDHKSVQKYESRRERSDRNESRSSKRYDQGPSKGSQESQLKDPDSLIMNGKPEEKSSSTSCPPPGLKTPSSEVKALPDFKSSTDVKAPGIKAPPGIKIPPPDIKPGPPGLNTSPGIRITGPPPGFDSNPCKSDNLNNDGSLSAVTPPPGFDFR